MVVAMKHEKLDFWINQAIELCQPDHIHYCDGSEQEYAALCKLMISQGTMVPLNSKKRPNSYLCRTDPSDTARVEDRTFICSKTAEEAGPTNNWKDPSEMLEKMKKLFRGCMRGRTMYVIPYCMGPLNSPLSQIGIELTDSPYVVCNMHLMTRAGRPVWELLNTRDFVPGLHSVGMPLEKGQKDVPWPCNTQETCIAHFPETRQIWSFGSGYGGNALLGKKCLALRIASVMGRDEGWLAEHMLIMGITNPAGEKKYIAAAFPSSCGKTNLAMLTPSLPGWKVETVGDDIAWMHFGKNGQLYAINPEAGFFGVAPGTSMASNPNAIKTLSENAIFTNTALTDDGDVWWEGMTEAPPGHAIDWLGKDWTPESGEKAAQANSRFTVASKQCPVIDPAWQDPQGVPISAILFGGRRSQVMPLVCEAFNWQHGVFLGASLSSETTAAIIGKQGKLRHDPFAMLPFCGYNMGNYFKHWLNIGKQHPNPALLPKIYYVNWFRKNSDGRFLWPGFGENSRVLKWIFERLSGNRNALQTPIGYFPETTGLDLSGLSLTSEDINQLFELDKPSWLNEVEELSEYFSIFGSQFPPELQEEIANLRKRLSNN